MWESRDYEFHQQSYLPFELYDVCRSQMEIAVFPWCAVKLSHNNRRKCRSQVEKVRAAMARNTFWRQNVKNTSGSEEGVPGCISCSRRSTRNISSKHVRGQVADFRRGVAFRTITSSGLLRWFCVTGAALRMTWRHFFVARAVLWTDGVVKTAKHISTRPSALHSQKLLRFWHSFDIVNVKNWGYLVEFLLFGGVNFLFL